MEVRNMRTLPTLWDEKYLKTTMNVDVVNEAIEICDEGISKLNEIHDICIKRKEELSKLTYKYLLRLFYTYAYESGPYYHPAEYNVVLLKIPILDGVGGTSRIIESSNSGTYTSARLQFNEINRRYKRLHPQLSDEVPDELKHTRGDL